MNITTTAKQRDKHFDIYEVTADGRTVSVLINFETEAITVTPFFPLPRGHFQLRDWVFDNTRENPSAVATIAGLAVLLGRA